MKMTAAKTTTAALGTELAAADTTAIMNDVRTTAIQSQKLKRHLVHFLIDSPPSAFAAGFLFKQNEFKFQASEIRVQTSRLQVVAAMSAG